MERCVIRAMSRRREPQAGQRRLGFLVLLALLLEQHRARGSSGVCLATAAAIKGYPILFALPSVVARERRSALGLVLGLIVLLSLVPAIFMGPGRAIEFVGVVIERVRDAGSSTWMSAPNAQYLPAVLGRWTGVESLQFPFHLLSWGWFSYTVLEVVKLSCNSGPRDRCLSYAMLALSLPLVISPSWPHYFVLLPFAQLVLADRAGDCIWVRVSLGVSVLLSNALTFRLVGDAEAFGASGALLVADLVLLAALQCWIRRRSSEAQSSSPVA